MKHFAFILLIVSVLINCTSNTAGTADDVNTGSIFGKLMYENGSPINDTVSVLLYKDSEPVDGLAKQSIDSNGLLHRRISTDGSYFFDSLSDGTYTIVVTKDDIVVGEETDIKIVHKDQIEVDITIMIIINQTFNIWNIDNSRNITVNEFHIDNGIIEQSDSGGYILTTVDTDTLLFKIDIKNDNKINTITVRITKKEDGTTLFEIVDTNNEEEVNVIITGGTGLATGFLEDISIDLHVPGTTAIESTFDTSGVPKKSR